MISTQSARGSTHWGIPDNRSLRGACEECAPDRLSGLGISLPIVSSLALQPSLTRTHERFRGFATDRDVAFHFSEPRVRNDLERQRSLLFADCGSAFAWKVRRPVAVARDWNRRRSGRGLRLRVFLSGAKDWLAVRVINVTRMRPLEPCFGSCMSCSCIHGSSLCAPPGIFDWGSIHHCYRRPSRKQQSIVMRPGMLGGETAVLRRTTIKPAMFVETGPFKNGPVSLLKRSFARDGVSRVRRLSFQRALSAAATTVPAEL